MYRLLWEPRSEEATGMDVFARETRREKAGNLAVNIVLVVGTAVLGIMALIVLGLI